MHAHGSPWFIPVTLNRGLSLQPNEVIEREEGSWSPLQVWENCQSCIILLLNLCDSKPNAWRMKQILVNEPK